MKFGLTDHIVQLGVVPTLTAHLRREYPEESASLWQRGAKAHHRRIVESLPEVARVSPLARQVRGALSLCCLLVGFHVAAPRQAGFSCEAFDALVQRSLCSPAVPFVLGAVDYLDPAAREALGDFFAAGRGASDQKVFQGSVDACGRDDAPCSLRCTVTRCGLVRMLAEEKRFFLLGSLCQVEESMAALGGGDLVRASCIARGDACCELRFERGGE